MPELTEAQDEQVDHIHGLAYQVMCDLLGEELEWDIEWIGQIADDLTDIAINYFGKTEMEVYPYQEDQQAD